MQGLKRFRDSYDVIVAGGGMGGLGAALRLALNGLDVLLLEQHNMVGGYATSFIRGDFEYECSLHALCEFGEGDVEKLDRGEAIPHEERGWARRFVEDECGMDFDLVRTPHSYRCCLSDYGIDVTVPFGRQGVIDAIESVSPGDGEKIARYLDVCREMSDALAAIEAMPKINKGEILTKHMEFVRLAGYSVYDVNQQFGFQKKTIQVLNCMVGYLGLSMKIICFPVWAVMLHRYFTQGAHIPHNTSHHIANTIELRLRELGVQIECCCRIERFTNTGKRVDGVVLEDGTVIKAKNVVCDILPTIAITRMLAPEVVPERMKKLYNVRKLAVSPFTLYLGLDCSPEEAGIDSYEYFIGNNLNTEEIAETVVHWVKHPKLVVTCIDVAIPGQTGKGKKNKCQLNFAELYDCRAMLEALDKYEYRATNEMLANWLIDRFEKGTGAYIREHIEDLCIATPATFARYAGALRGDIYGYEQTALDGIISRTLCLEEERFIEGLEFVGGGAFRTVGYSCTMGSGMKAADFILKEREAN